MSDNEKLIAKKKKEINEEIWKFQRDKKEELRQFCVDNGGHYFWDWQRRFQEMFNPEFSHYLLERRCHCCEFTESKKESSENKND